MGSELLATADRILDRVLMYMNPQDILTLATMGIPVSFLAVAIISAIRKARHKAWMARHNYDNNW